MRGPQRPASDPLVEACVTAHRTRDANGLPEPPAAWFDLPDAGLDRLFTLQLEARAIERALDPRGRTSTVRAVLDRL